MAKPAVPHERSRRNLADMMDKGQKRIHRRDIVTSSQKTEDVAFYQELQEQLKDFRGQLEAEDKKRIRAMKGINASDSDEQKLAKVAAMTAKNKADLQKCFDNLASHNIAGYSFECIQPVKTAGMSDEEHAKLTAHEYILWKQQVKPGKIFIAHNTKTPESSIAKAHRLQLVQEAAKTYGTNPDPEARGEGCHGIEHLRDTFRFEAVVASFKDITMLVFLLVKELGWKAIKLDYTKMVVPKTLGWRFVGIDFKAENGQFIEVYIVFLGLATAKLLAPVNSEKVLVPGGMYFNKVSNHLLFEEIRPLDIRKCSMFEKQKIRAIEIESKRRYDTAYLKHLEELDEQSWDAFWSTLLNTDDDRACPDYWAQRKIMEMVAATDETASAVMSLERKLADIDTRLDAGIKLIGGALFAATLATLIHKFVATRR